jgi:hypothetical protein
MKQLHLPSLYSRIASPACVVRVQMVKTHSVSSTMPVAGRAPPHLISHRSNVTSPIVPYHPPPPFVTPSTSVAAHDMSVLPLEAANRIGPAARLYLAITRVSRIPRRSHYAMSALIVPCTDR